MLTEPTHYYYQGTAPAWGSPKITFRVRVDGGRTFPQELLHALAIYALSRGVANVNIIDTPNRFKSIYKTCRSLSIPVELLQYVIDNHLPLSVLEELSFVRRDIDERVSGKGIVLAFAGAEIDSQAFFETAAGQPIILRENCTLRGSVVIKPGIVIQPGQLIQASA